MTLNENQRLICAGEMPLRAPNGEQIAAVPVYKVVSAEDVGADSTVELLPNERLLLVGSEQSKAAAEERYNALMAGRMPTKLRPTALYIKEPANDSNGDSGLTENEKRVLNPLIADLLEEFSAAMRERETLERQGKAANRK